MIKNIDSKNLTIHVNGMVEIHWPVALVSDI